MNQAVRDKANVQELTARKVPEALSLLAVARSSIASRITGVCECIDELASQPQNPADTVHRLRVACRRAATCLAFFSEVFDSASRCRLSRLLRTLRRKAGEVRDIDVLSERIRSGKGRGARKLLENCQSRRDSRARKLLGYANTVSPEISSVQGDGLSLLLINDQEAVLTVPFRPLGVERVTDAGQRFLKSLRKADRSAKFLHRARIDGKKLRYSLEILEPAIPGVAESLAGRRLRTFQHLLGDIHDHHLQRKSLQRLARKFGTNDVRRFVEKEVRKGKRQAQKDFARLQAMCSRDEADSFSRELAELLHADP